MKTTQSLTSWHKCREHVLEEMRSLEAEIARHRSEEQRLRPRYGEVAVGSADFDHLLNAAVAEEFLRSIRKGDTPDVACREAKKASRDCITKWNAHGCKSRMPVSSHHEYHRWEGSGDCYAEVLRRRFNAVDK